MTVRGRFVGWVLDVQHQTPVLCGLAGLLRCRQDQACAGVLHEVMQPVRRVFGRERHIRSTGLQDGQCGGDERDGAVGEHTDWGLDPHALPT